jgi:hypothetical protein
MRGWLSVLVGLAVVATVAAPGGFALATTVAAPPLHLGPAWASSSSSAYNWAGYAATGATGSVTKVTGSWTQPSVTCKKGTTLAAFWIGIDGYTSSTVEQDGTLAQCSHGSATYYSWWETYPANSVQEWAAISAGNAFTSSVTYNTAANTFTMKLTDTTTGASWSKTSANSGAEENSAECIAERPAGADNTSGLYALAKFTTATFATCIATISGSTGGIGTFGTVTSITMVSYPSGSRVLASVSALTSDTEFTVTWKHAS